MLNRMRDRVRSVMGRLGSLLQRPIGRGGGAGRSRIVRPWREDAQRGYPMLDMTPKKLMSLLQKADHGAPDEQFDLYTDMLQKWPRLAAVEATRRIALTGLEYEITPSLPARGDASAGERGASARRADATAARSAAAAEYCREVLAGLDNFRETLDRLAGAIGFGIAVAELVWEAGRLIDIVPAPHSRLMVNANEPWRIRVRTEDEPTIGVAIDEQPGKWIVHQPQSLAGRQFDGGLLRASALMFLAHNTSFKQWLTFTEIAGMPMRIGQFDPGTQQADKEDLLKMLRVLGTDAVSIVPKNMEVRLLETKNAAERVYESLQEYCNTEVTILWLGQHLTTDIGASGSRAAADVQDF